MLYNILVNAHSGLRWIVLLLLVYNIINIAMARSSNRALAAKDTKLSLFGMLSVHIQILVGLVLYFISPKVQFSANTMSDGVLRFFTMEHTLGMLIAIILITIAHRRVKSGSAAGAFWYYVFGLLVILVSIPWPFRGFGTGWF
jgi:hypothetical protein